MKTTIATYTWAMATLMAVATGTAAQESKPTAPPSTQETAGPNLRVRFLETRQKGGQQTSARTSLLLLRAGDESAHVFAGTQIALRTSDRGAPTVVFKDAGVFARVGAQSRADGRYRLEASFEVSSILAGAGEAAVPEGSNPVLQVVKSESVLVVREGDTTTLGSAVDPVTGEVVRVDVVLEVVPTAKVASTAARPDERVHARFVLNRRRGEKRIASRPYSVVLQVGEQKAANVFSGAMLPLEMSYEGRPTVMLKDIGAGLRLAAFPAGDGVYRINLSVSDGALSASSGAPRVQAFQAESRLYLRKGDTVVVASAVDPQTGDVVEAELMLQADQ